VYDTIKLTSKADCDVLIEQANEEKSDLLFRKTAVEHQTSGYEKTASSVEADLQSSTAQLNALTTVIAGLPEGQVKDANVTKQKKLELRVYLLNQKKENYGAFALLLNQFEKAKIELELTEVDSFIDALQTRKAALPA
jgi:hypothetical protein